MRATGDSEIKSFFFFFEVCIRIFMFFVGFDGECKGQIPFYSSIQNYKYIIIISEFSKRDSKITAVDY